MPAEDLELRRALALRAVTGGSETQIGRHPYRASGNR
jgi:hypothetical protein